jgi:hypothetical protein
VCFPGEALRIVLGNPGNEEVKKRVTSEGNVLYLVETIHRKGSFGLPFLNVRNTASASGSVILQMRLGYVQGNVCYVGG